MFKNLFLISFFFLILFSSIYPTYRERTEFSNYCSAFEKILFRNTLKKNNNILKRINSISKNATKSVTSRTNGALVNKTIDQYKAFKNSFMLDFVPNKFFCFGGYWIEMLKPGLIEDIFYEKSKERINELIDLKEEVDVFINDINKEFKTIKKEFNFLFR